MIEEHFIKDLVEKYLAEHWSDLYLVDLKVHPNARVVVELGSAKGISIDQCAELSKYIESQLDREVEDFELEVGSAGITAPFKVLRQYLDSVGEEITVLRKGGIKEHGILNRASERVIELIVERKVKPEGAKRKMLVKEHIEIPMEEILEAKRVIKI